MFQPTNTLIDSALAFSGLTRHDLSKLEQSLAEMSLDAFGHEDYKKYEDTEMLRQELEDWQKESLKGHYPKLETPIDLDEADIQGIKEEQAS